MRKGLTTSALKAFRPLGPAVGLLAAMLLSPGPVAADTPITLADAVRMAIERNLDLRVQAFVPTLAGTDVRRADAIYDPTVSALADHKQAEDPVTPTSSSSDRTRSVDANVSLGQLLPSGASLSSSFTNLWSWNDFATRGTPSTHFAQPTLALTFAQPILQGFGREVTERNISAASDAREAAFAGWRSKAIATVGSVRGQYYALIQARDNLSTLRASLDVARQLHAENQAKVRAGVLPAIDLLDSEFGVEQRQFGLLDGERAVADASDQLRLLIQLPGADVLAPQESFPNPEVRYDETEEIRKAFEKRPDLLQARIVLRSQERNARISDNLALPSVDITGSAGLAGLGYNYGNAVGDVGKGTFPFWTVGVKLSYPLGNNAAEADRTASRLQVRQAKVQIRSLETSASLDVRSAIRNLTTRRRQIEVAEKGVQDGAARLASFLKRKSLGLATTRDVLEAEADLTTARESLTAARADYQTALTQLWVSTGDLLDRQGIFVKDQEIENMAWKELP